MTINRENNVSSSFYFRYFIHKNANLPEILFSLIRWIPPRWNTDRATEINRNSLIALGWNLILKSRPILQYLLLFHHLERSKKQRPLLDVVRLPFILANSVTEGILLFDSVRFHRQVNRRCWLRRGTRDQDRTVTDRSQFLDQTVWSLIISAI